MHFLSQRFRLQQSTIASEAICSAEIDPFDRLTHWRYCWSKYLRRLKWAMCQHFTPLCATDREREPLLVKCEQLIEWLMGREDPNQHFQSPSPEDTTQEASSFISFLGVRPSSDCTFTLKTKSTIYSSAVLIKGLYHLFWPKVFWGNDS